MDPITSQQKKDIRIIGKFLEVYCADKHRAAKSSFIDLPTGLGERNLCPDCASFLEYVIAKRIKCPLEAEKPTCKHCQIHCYGKAERERIREIMAYSGRKLMLRGRLDYVWHYLF